MWASKWSWVVVKNCFVSLDMCSFKIGETHWCQSMSEQFQQCTWQIKRPQVGNLWSSIITGSFVKQEKINPKFLSMLQIGSLEAVLWPQPVYMCMKAMESVKTRCCNMNALQGCRIEKTLCCTHDTNLCCSWYPLNQVLYLEIWGHKQKLMNGLQNLQAVSDPAWHKDIPAACLPCGDAQYWGFWMESVWWTFSRCMPDISHLPVWLQIPTSNASFKQYWAFSCQESALCSLQATMPCIVQQNEHHYKLICVHSTAVQASVALLRSMLCVPSCH